MVNKEHKKVTVGSVLSWIVGVIFIFGGLGMLFSLQLISALVFFVMGSVLVPPLNKFVSKKIKFDLSSKWIKALVIVIGFILLGVFTDVEETAPTTQEIASPQETVAQPTTQEKTKESPATTPTSIQKESKTTKLYTGYIASLFPTRAEIDTEFKITNEQEFNISSYYTQYNRNDIYSVGFKEGKVMDFEIFEGTSFTMGNIVIFIFDTENNANKFYNSFTTLIKNEGGYKEKSSSGINANCFAIEDGNSLEGYRRNVYCYKNNVFFNTEIGTFKLTRLSMYKDWAEIIDKKITN